MSADLEMTDVVERSKLDSIRNEIERIVARYVEKHGVGATVVPGLSVGRATAPIAPSSYLFEPSLCVGARGSKRVHLGEASYVYDEHHFLLTAVGLPTIIEVAEASEDAPYTALQLKLDLHAARQVIGEVETHRLDTARSEAGIATGPVDGALLDAVVRLVRLLDTPRDIPILHANIHREILYRVLVGPAGARLRQIVQVGSQGGRIAKAVERLQRDFSKKLKIEDLADEVGMGVSTLHHHFREITTMSPLQFQKQLRLHEARRLMLTEDADAANAAIQVGYESVTQFNREYRRLFGAPPVKDVRAMRAAHSAELASKLNARVTATTWH